MGEIQKPIILFAVSQNRKSCDVDSQSVEFGKLAFCESGFHLTTYPEDENSGSKVFFAEATEIEWDEWYHTKCVCKSIKLLKQDPDGLSKKMLAEWQAEFLAVGARCDAELDSVYSKWNAEFGVVEAKWKPYRDVVYSKWGAERDTIYAKLKRDVLHAKFIAKYKPEMDAVYAKFQPEFDAVNAKWQTEIDAIIAKWRNVLLEKISRTLQVTKITKSSLSCAFGILNISTRLFMGKTSIEQI